MCVKASESAPLLCASVKIMTSSARIKLLSREWPKSQTRIIKIMGIRSGGREEVYRFMRGLAPLPGLIQAMLRAEQVEDRFDRIGSNREMKNPPEEGGFQ